MDESERSNSLETVQQLGPDSRGRWLITTKTSRHVWDLDACTYQRLPGDDAPPFSWDARVVRLTRVDQWPVVGEKSLIWFDDPGAPASVEQWRRSATIQSIRRLSAPDA
jgi:hypothetical protein